MTQPPPPPEEAKRLKALAEQQNGGPLPKPKPFPASSRYSVAPPETVTEAIVARLNSFVTCGCGDDEWPQLRYDTVKLIDAMASARPLPRGIGD